MNLNLQIVFWGDKESALWSGIQPDEGLWFLIPVTSRWINSWMHERKSELLLRSIHVHLRSSHIGILGTQEHTLLHKAPQQSHQNLFIHKVLTSASTWMKLKNVMLGERSQSQRGTPCVTPWIWNVPEQVNFHRQKDWWTPGAGKGTGSAYTGTTGLPLWGMEMPGSGAEVVLVQLSECTKCLWMVCFKTVAFMSTWFLSQFKRKQTKQKHS